MEQYLTTDDYPDIDRMNETESQLETTENNIHPLRPLNTVDSFYADISMSHGQKMREFEFSHKKNASSPMAELVETILDSMSNLKKPQHSLTCPSQFQIRYRTQKSSVIPTQKPKKRAEYSCDVLAKT